MVKGTTESDSLSDQPSQGLPLGRWLGLLRGVPPTPLPCTAPPVEALWVAAWAQHLSQQGAGEHFIPIPINSPGLSGLAPSLLKENPS